MRIIRIKISICIALAVLLETVAFSQSIDSVYYTFINEGDVLTACQDVIEEDSCYYAFTQNIIDPIAHFSTLLKYDKKLNLIHKKQLMLGDSNMIVKVLPTKDAFWCFGSIRTDRSDKVFSVKLNKNFDVMHQPTLYYLEDTIDYGVVDVIMNEKNQFVLLMYGMQNELMLLDSTLQVLKTNKLDAYSYCCSIEEFQGNYIVDLGRFLFIIDKDSLSIIDTVKTDILCIHPVGNLLKLNDSVFIRSADFSNSTPEVFERDMAILFYNKQFEVFKQVQVGQVGYFDEYGYSNLDFITKDSIYYAYSTRLSSPSIPVEASSVSIACMNEKGEKHFDYQFNIPEDLNTVKRICGIIATSDGGCLVHGISIRYTYEGSNDTGQFKGFLLKYNPQWQKASITELPKQYEIAVYPNPASNQIVISGNEVQMLDVFVYTITGQKVKQVVVNATQTTIDVNDLSVGMYILKINTKQDILTRKVQIIK
ncbi:MAG: T9SS type A sorting domain-containing protein [Bacteroidales bacterium]|nr:T9SS type A sorting domain-containing protein [Bacteroidales bacterium]